METLETHYAPAGFVVSMIGDAGMQDPRFGLDNWGDLRYCITQAVNGGGGTITLGYAAGNYGPNNVWGPGLSGATTTLESALPALAKDIRFCLATVTGASGNAG